jgi:aminoglycoside 6'-N-acetyltransferase
MTAAFDPIDARVRLRDATADDRHHLEAWDRDEAVMAAAGHDGQGGDITDGGWLDELALMSPVYRYLIAEMDGRPIGAMLLIDPHLEPTRYWGDIAPHQRAIDIWIGHGRDRGRGHGTAMMRRALQLCFADLAIEAIVIDPLASNTRAHIFYQRLGFEPQALRRFGDDDCLVHRLTRETWQARWPQDGEGTGRLTGP